MVQIKHRITGLYDKKGMTGWSKKGGAWGSMGQAKAHVNLYIKYPWRLQEYMESDFIELDENNQVVITPVSDYIIPKIKNRIKNLQQSNWRDYSQEINQYKQILGE